MKQQEKMCSNENNLYNFYRLIGQGNYASLTEAGGYSYVTGKMGAWPQVIFDIRFKSNIVEKLDQAFEVANETGYTTSAVVNKQLLMECDQEQLRKYGIFPIGLWPLMEIKEMGETTYSKPNVDIEKLVSANDLKAFSLLMNEDFKALSGFGEDLLVKLEDQESISIYGIFPHEELVGGLVSYTDKHMITGLYFIVIHQEYRGRGYGKALTKFVVRDLFNSGTTKVVLQSFSNAAALYSDTGFIRNGELVVLMK